MTSLITRSIRLAAVAFTAASIFMFAGCSNDSPVMPGAGNGDTNPPPVEIKTPRKMRINYIYLQGVALVKSNGDSWDLDPFSAANRRPDVYFKLGDYTTGVIENYDAVANPGMEKLSFSAPNYGQMNYDGSYTLKLLDQDGALQGADDLIGQMTFRPDEYYDNDNAREFSMRVYQDSKFNGYAYGVWIY